MANRSNRGSPSVSGLGFDSSEILNMLSSPEFKKTLAKAYEGAVSARNVIRTLSEPETAKKLHRLSETSGSIAETTRQLAEEVSKLGREGKLSAAGERLKFAAVFIDQTVGQPRTGRSRVEQESISGAATEVVRALMAVVAEFSLLFSEMRTQSEAATQTRSMTAE